MMPQLLKWLPVPGSPDFLLIALVPGIFLLYRRKDGGRAGKVWVTILVALYLVWSIPATAVPLIRAMSPSYPPVRSLEAAHGATAIVVLGAGMDTFRSRGEIYSGGTREHGLRMLEAAAVYHALPRPWVIVTGSLGNERISQAHQMAVDLQKLGVDPERIIEEAKAANTRDHALLVPPMLKERGVTQFVLVTSQQHIARALEAFQKVGWDPIPSTPEFFVLYRPSERFVPGKAALDASAAMIYDELAMAYYWYRGWI